MNEAELAAALSRALGRPVRITHTRGVSGGDINQARHLKTSAGDFFVKFNRSAPKTAFSSEAAALTAMRDAQSVLRIPQVIYAQDPGSGPGYLVLEYIDTTAPTADYDQNFGRGLAALHRAAAPKFGFEVGTYCGSSSQPNSWSEDWIAFYQNQRLEHQLQLGSSAYSAAQRKTIRRLLDVLPERLAAPDEAPALIHGDLWAGNAMVDETGAPTLVDPASYYAHREAEFGMMTLMGGFSAAVYDSYHEAFPLAQGWRERNPLYQLYHLMNHATLFGGGYASQAARLAERFV